MGPVRVRIGDRIVAFSDMPTPEDVDHVAAQLEGISPRGETSASVNETPTSVSVQRATRAVGMSPRGANEIAGGDSLQSVTEDVATLAGAIPGVLTLNPAAAVGGGLGARGLARTGFDIAQGKTDWRRGGVQALGVAGAQALLPGAGPAAAVARSGLASGIAGQMYDLAKNLASGKTSGGSLKETAQTVLGDVGAGALGEVLAQSSAAGSEARRLRRQNAINEVEQRRAQYERAGITPSASELTGSSGLAQVEALPRAVPVGGGRAREFAKTQAEQARGSADRFIGDLSPANLENELQAGQHAQKALDAGFHASEAKWKAAFDASEAVTGDEPVVPVSHLLPTLNVLAETGKKVPVGSPAYAARMTRELVTSFGFDPNDAAQFAQAAQTGKISFPLARRMESQFGRMGYRGRPPVGMTPQQAQAATAYQSLLMDLDQFYSTGQGQEVHPVLQEAKSLFKDGLALYNESKAKLFLDGRTPPEVAIRAAFKSGNITDTRAVKAALPIDAWEAATQGWLRGQYDKASEGGQFSEAKFASAILPYTRNGQLEEILGQEKADQLVNMLNVYRQRANMRRPTIQGSSENRGAMAQMAAAGWILKTLMSNPKQAAGEAAITVGLPMLASLLTTSPAGREALVSMSLPRAPASMLTRRAVGTLAAEGLGR